MAAGVRVARLVEAQATDPLYARHLLDSAFYDEMARRILDTGPNLDGPFLMAPLYGYFLAAVYGALGLAPTPVYALQVLLGSATAGMAARLGERLGGPLAAWIAGLAVALYGQSVMYDVRLLSVSLSTFLTTLGALVLLAAWRAERMGIALLGALGAGLVLGLETTARGNLLLALPFLTLAWWARGRLGVLQSVAFALAAAGPLVLTTAHNQAQGEPNVPVSVNGGINLYRGNNPLFVDEAVHPFRLTGGKDALARKARLVASIETGDWVGYRETDRYWTRRTIAEWKAQPGRYLLLFGRKLMQALGYREVGDNDDVEHEVGSSRVLRVLPAFLWGPVCVLGFLGLLAGHGAPRRTWRDDLPLRILLLVGFASIALFFFVSRYRVPLFPLLAAYAGACVAGLRAAWLVRDVPVLRNAALATALLLLVVFVDPNARWLPWHRTDATAATARAVPCAVDTHHLRESGLEERFKVAAHQMSVGDLKGAEEGFRAVWTADRNHLAAGVDLSFVLLQRGAFSDAAAVAVDVVQRDRCDDKAYANLGLALLRMGRPDEAARALEQAIRIEKYEPNYWLGLGQAYLVLGRDGDAKILFDRSVKWGPPDAWEARYLLGRLLVKDKDYATAQSLFSEALERSPGRAEVLAWSGLAAFGSEDYAVARARLEQARRIAPDEPAVQGLTRALLMAPPAP